MNEKKHPNENIKISYTSNDLKQATAKHRSKQM